MTLWTLRYRYRTILEARSMSEFYSTAYARRLLLVTRDSDDARWCGVATSAHAAGCWDSSQIIMSY